MGENGHVLGQRGFTPIIRNSFVYAGEKKEDGGAWRTFGGGRSGGGDGGFGGLRGGEEGNCKGGIKKRGKNGRGIYGLFTRLFGARREEGSFAICK